MRTATTVRAVVGLVAALSFAVPVSAQITTGNVSGTVTDAQGGVIPGASVALVSETQSIRRGPVVTNGEGIYVFPNIAADIYTVEVTLSGFKTLTRRGITVSGGDRVSVEPLVLETGGVSEQVEVTANSMLIQAASGERSGTISEESLRHLPIGSGGTNPGHGFMETLSLLPGVVAGSPGSQQRRIGGGGQDNIMLDGLSALDTGNNGVMSGMNLPVDAIAEVKVLASGYSAEYGRSSGVQVSAVTRSGTNRFHGTIFTYERDSDWRENSWTNQKNGNPKPVDQQRDWGYTIGGPVGRPGGDNKLFFFYSQEFRPRTSGGNTSNIRVPTALERQGDFSQTLDNQGNLFNRIYNPASGLPRSRCSATGADVAACFADGGVLGRVPRNMLYGPGIALLNMYPLPTIAQAQGTSFNYQNFDAVRHTMGYTPNVKVDYQFSTDLRATWKINMASARIVPTPGNLPGLTDNIQKFPTSFNTAWAVNYTFTPTTFLEASYGVNQNRLGNVPIGPFANRNNVVCPSDLGAQIPNCTMGGLAFLFPDAGVIDERTYQYQALRDVGTPILDGNRIVMPPQIGWGNTRIGSAPPSISYPGFLNLNRIQQFSVSVTKVIGRHTAKAGVYFEHSFKAQNQNNQFQGNLSFGVDNNNTIDSQYPFANAALGIFTSYTQQSRMVEGNFYYNNLEWFLQDNWKVTPQLTLDYGVRIAHDGPYIDNFRQVANFFEDRWSLADAPLLYQPGCVGASPCSGNNRQARDPRSGQLLGPGSSGLIGAMVIGTGDPANGMVLAGQGIHKAGYTWPSIAVGPRFGGAYDLTGDQTTVLRGSVGLYFDRPDGNVAFGTVGNPPTGGSLTQQWGFLADIANPVLAFGPVPNLTMNLYDSAIPKDFQWNAEVQRALPWASSLSVAYAGHHAFDVLGGQQNGNPVNLNTIDLGTTLGPAGIDPTTGTALNNNLLRPFRGYGNINIQWARFYRNYHSIQSAFTRRFRDNFQFGVSHTWTLRDFGNVGLQDVQLRIDHNPDASWFIRDDQATAEKLFGNQGTTTHIVKGNFIYDLPDMNVDGKFLRALSLLANDWQVAGVVSVDSGGKYDLGYSYNTGPSGQALTGSPNYNARIVLNDLGALGSGCSSDQYAQFNNTMVGATGGASPVMTPALSGPQVGSAGLESGRDYLTGCPDHMVDLAIQRTIRLGGGRRLDIRFDVFNAFNQVIYTGRSSTLQLNSVTDQTVRNSQFLADGSIDPNRLTPNSAGFGAVNGAATLRNIQLQVRFGF